MLTPTNYPLTNQILPSLEWKAVDIFEAERQMRDGMGGIIAENLAEAYETDGFALGRNVAVVALWGADKGNFERAEWEERRMHYITGEYVTALLNRGGTSFKHLTYWLTAVVVSLCLAACVTPAWEPGDPPLTFSVDTARTSELVLMGCALWAAEGIGLECEIVESGAIVDARRSDLPAGRAAYSKTRPCGVLWTDRSYTTEFDPQAYDLMDADVLDPPNAEAKIDRAAAIAAHEIGHLLGIWDHLPAGNVMDAAGGTNAITPADVRALPWAEELR